METVDKETLMKMKAIGATFNTLSEHCFMDCVFDFTTRKIIKREENCLKNCAQKYLKGTQRIQQRVMEHATGGVETPPTLK